MKILLIYPSHRMSEAPCLLPLGLAYIASVLKGVGHKIEVLDIEGYRWSRKVVEEKIKASNFDVVGIGGIISSYNYVKWLTKNLKNKNPNAKIVVGGAHATSIPEIILENTKADICVIGEGELTIEDLIQKIEQNGNLNEVDGIYFKENSKIFNTKPRKLIENLDELPYPARELFPVEIYIRNPLAGNHNFRRFRQLTMSSARGCPYPCTFCFNAYGKKIRLRSNENIIAEMAYLKDKYRVNWINFVDDLFMTSEKRVIDFCRKLKKENLDLAFTISGRANIVTESIVSALSQVNCKKIGYGLESGSPKILKRMRKQITPKQSENAIRLTRKYRIPLSTTFMLGYFDEDKQTIKETINFCKRNKIAFPFFYATPYPGTAIYEECLQKGLIKDKEEFVKQLGEAKEMIVNLTKIPSDKLIRIRNKAYKELRENVHLTFRFKEYLKSHGLINTAYRIIVKIRDQLRRILKRF